MQRAGPRSVLPLAAAALLACAAPAHGADDAVSAVQMVDALEAAFGVTPGARRSHTKGTCARGVFIGSAAAAPYTRSALFSGAPVPVVARFSIAGGNPGAADTTPNARGMALDFHLPHGARQVMAMLSTPVFGAAFPKTFYDLLLAIRPDPATGRPDPHKIATFRATHPDNFAQAQFLAANNPPASYASSAYYGVHTFRFVNAQDTVTLVRWRFVPQDGEKRLSDAEMDTAGPDFLEQALIARTRRGPLRWDMLLTLGEPGDTATDPTVEWPASRRTLRVGTLSITAAAAQHGGACERINFDPLVMADGIAATDDPVLQFRSAAYAVSAARRLGGH